MIDYALKIKELRKFLSLTQEQLGENIGASRSIISQIEIGKFKPTLEMISEIARLYSINPSYFFKENFPLSKDPTSEIQPISVCQSCIDKERMIVSLEKNVELLEKLNRSLENQIK
jgi:putative transcriptional regulator